MQQPSLVDKTGSGTPYAQYPSADPGYEMNHAYQPQGPAGQVVYPQAVVYGYSNQAPGPVATDSAYLVPQVQPRRRTRSRCCVACCGLIACLIIAGIITGIVFLALYLRCVNGPAGMDKVEFNLGVNVTGIRGKQFKDSGALWTKFAVKADDQAKNITAVVSTRGASTSIANAIKIEVSVVDGVAEFLVSGVSGSFMQCPQASIDVKIPRSLANVLNLDIAITNGVINIDDTLTYGSLVLQTLNGDIKTDGYIHADTVEAKTTNGDIEFDIRLKNTCVLKCTATNGDIEIEHLEFDESTVGKACSVNLETTNGDIESKHVKMFAGTYDLKTTNGDIGVTGPRVKKDVDKENKQTGTVGTGSMSFKSLTTNGDVEVNFE